MIYDLIIIGAGPAGIEAALQAAGRGLSYVLIEKDDAGALIEQTMANKKFFHVYGRNTAQLKGELAFPDRSKGYELVELWKKQVSQLSFHAGETLLEISGDSKQTFTVTTTKDSYQSRFVLLTSGTFENPKKLNVPGEQGNPNIQYSLDYYFEYQDKDIVIVGGGNSALETAIYCGPDNRVTMVVRGKTFAESATQKNVDDLAELTKQGKIKVIFNASVTNIAENTVDIKNLKSTQTLPYDHLFVHIGFQKPTEFLTSLGITVAEDKPVYNEQFESNIPDLYIAGALTGSDSIVECANQTYDIVDRIAKLCGRGGKN